LTKEAVALTSEWSPTWKLALENGAGAQEKNFYRIPNLDALVASSKQSGDWPRGQQFNAVGNR